MKKEIKKRGLTKFDINVRRLSIISFILFVFAVLFFSSQTPSIQNSFNNMDNKIQMLIKGVK
jgi:hypothetical protein